MGLGDDIGYFFTKIIAGRAVAERSERRQLDKKYAPVAEDLKKVKKVQRESVESNTTKSEYPKPLPSRIPLEGTIRRRRPPLDRSQSDTGASEARLSTSDAVNLLPNAAKPPLEGQKPRLKDDFWENGVSLEMPALKGFGRYRMAVDADEDFQREHLKRTMSDLTDEMVISLGEFNRAALDPVLWQSYQNSRRSSAASSTASLAKMSSMTVSESFDPKRSVNTVHGFAPSLISSSSSSTPNMGSHHYRKDSVVSMTSMSSDGRSRSRQRKSRQISIPISDNSGSPLDTISENPDVPEKSRPKVHRRCRVDETAKIDSALASDGSDDEARVPELDSMGTRSHLTQKSSQRRRIPNSGREPARPQTRSGDQQKSRHPAKHAVDRTKTIKHSVRPATRRVHSHRQSRTKHNPVEIPKSDIPFRQATNAEHQKAEHSRAVSPSSPMRFPSPNTSEESKENPTDLKEYIEKAKRQHSSKIRRKKTREFDDDNASIHSNSTTKTVIPLATKIIESLPIHKRQRSATAIRIPASRGQAEGPEVEVLQETAH